MKASIQSRVLALVGAGVFLTVGIFSLLSRSSLMSLEQKVRQEHDRLAATIAHTVSQAVADDMRLLAGAAGASDEVAALAAVKGVLHFGRVASAAFLVNPDGTIAHCEPQLECAAVYGEEVRRLALDAIGIQRPAVSNTLPQPGGRMPLVCVMPFRPVEGRPAGAAGVLIDPLDRRLAELVQPAEPASTLRVELQDTDGRVLAAARGSAATEARTNESAAAVAGTPWILRVSETGADPVAPITSYRRRSLWLAPALAAVTMLLGWGIARSVRQPLIRLTAAAERIAAGDLDRAVPSRHAARGGDEVARLAMALEGMRTALKKSIEHIEKSNEELERRVAQRTHELAEANTALAERERVRQQLLRKVISAQEDERKRVARELHDETSQTLAALGIGVDMALAACGADTTGAIQQRLADVRRLVDRMHNELHRLIVNLRPSVLDDLGLAAAIAWFAERQLAPVSVAVRCELELDLRLPSEIETAIFRAVQEAIVNIARHAHAESVLIQGSVEGGALTVEIEDDGDGFDPGRVVESHESLRGVGLLGMRERIEILGGSLRIESKPGDGTRVVMTVPITASAQPSAVSSQSSAFSRNVGTDRAEPKAES